MLVTCYVIGRITAWYQRFAESRSIHQVPFPFPVSCRAVAAPSRTLKEGRQTRSQMVLMALGDRWWDQNGTKLRNGDVQRSSHRTIWSIYGGTVPYKAIFSGDIPLHRPYIALIYVGYLQFRILKWPLTSGILREFHIAMEINRKSKL